MQKLRGSGRTSRMVEHARKLAADGKRVVIVADNLGHSYQIRIDHQLMTSEHIQVKAFSQLRDFDWEHMTRRGDAQDVVYLVDHHAIEDRFATVIEMLHRFDPA